MHCTPQPALALSHQPKTYALHHLHTRYRAIHTSRSETLPSQRSCEYAHSENCTIFTVSVRKVSVQACASAFETSVQAHLKVQMCSSTLAVKLCSRSIASLTVKLPARSVPASTLAAKLRVRSQRSLESTRSFDRTRSFAATIVEASTHSSGSKLRYTRSFYFFRRNRSMVIASLTACRRVGDETRGSLREVRVKPYSNGAQTSPLGEVRAPFETEVSARCTDSGIAHLTSLKSDV